MMLIDPTTSCNLECVGCWARDYEKNINLSYDKLDELITDAKKLGVLQIIFTGGEPLMRKKDILKLAEKHNKLAFGMFTNGTLIDEEFAASHGAVGKPQCIYQYRGVSGRNGCAEG